MPRINRILMKNIGHSRAFMNDLELDFRGGVNTLVYADNGCGKSSIISLILSALRPATYDFLPGDTETRQKRKLTDYITKDFPAHIVIEWLLDNPRKKTEFLLTGAILEKDEQNNLRRSFYSIRYPKEIPIRYLHFENLPLESKSTFYSMEEVIKRLREQRSIEPGQKITLIRDNLSKWQNHLDSNLIDTTLVKFQREMNTTEGNQAKFLNFNTDMDFVKLIINTLQTLPKEESLDDIKHAYGKFKQIPYLQKQEKVLQKIIQRLKDGMELESQTKEYQTQLDELIHTWLKHQIIAQEEDGELNDQILDIENQLSILEPLLVEIEEKITALNIQIPYLRFITTEFKITDAESMIQKLQTEERELKYRKNLLEILDNYRNWKSKKRRLQILEDELLAEIKPIKEELMDFKLIITFVLKENLKKIEETKESLNSAILDKKVEIQQKGVEKGKSEEKLATLKKKIRWDKKELLEIEEEKQKVTQIIGKDYTPEEALEKLRLKLQRIDEQTKELKEKEDNLKQILDSATIKKDDLRNDLEKIRTYKEKIVTKYGQRQKKWKKVVNDPFFRVLVEDGWENQEVDYRVLREPNKQNVVQNEDRVRDEWISSKIISEESGKIISTYEDKEKFPYDPEILKIIHILQRNNIHAMMGWEYLTQLYPDSDDLDEKFKIATKIGHLLDGVIVIDENLNRVNRLLSELNQSSEIVTLTKPIAISSTKIFREPPLINENVTYVNPGFTWRYNHEDAEEYYQKILSQYQLQNDNVNELQKKHEDIKKLLTLWEDFLDSFPPNEYFELEQTQKDLEEDLKTSQAALEDLLSEMKQNKILLDGIEKEIEKNWKDKEKLNAQLQELSSYLVHHKRKVFLEKGTIKDNKEFQSESGRLNEINEKIPKLQNNEKQFISERDDILIQLKEIEDKLSSYLAEKEYQSQLTTDELQKRSSSMSLDEWIDRHDQVDKRLQTTYSHSELRLSIQSLKEDIFKLRSQLQKFYKKFRIKEDEIENFDKLHLMLKDIHDILSLKEDTEKQIGNLVKRIETIKGEISTYKINCTEYQVKYLAHEEELEEAFLEVQNDQKKIESILEDKETMFEDLEEEHSVKENEINLLNEQKTLREEEREKISSLLHLIKRNIQSLPKEAIEQASKDFTTLVKDKIESIESFDKEVHQRSDETSELQTQKELLDKSINEFIQHFKQILDDIVEEELKEPNLIEYIRRFNETNIVQISQNVRGFETRVSIIRDELEKPKERLSNIIKIFTTIISDILFKLKNLQNIKLEINELPYLDKKPIIKIHVKDSRDLAAIDATVRNYFNQLFLTYDEFPKDLDIRKIVMTIIQDYLEGRLRPIRYLFPEEKEEAVYKTITEVINASGGEKATIGIFLYCLIAYFRLKYLTKEEKRKSNYSSPLIMDNPFAKASRLDLIHLQVGIANELNIQLIPFTHHQIVEAFHNYENLIPLKKFETNTKKILELDKEFEYSIESGSVTVRPTIQLEQSELTSYIGD